MQGKYLDPNILSRVGPLDVVARQVVEGVRIGMHRSPSRGISSEFTAYRQYVPGDDVQHVDWKAYARSNRYYVKLYEAETNFVANLLLDVSGSMTYGSGGITKLEYAKYLAASLAYLVIDQGDSAGVGLFDGELQQYIQPSSGMGVLVDISRELERVEPKPRTRVGAVLDNFAHRMSRRGVAVLLSDMLDSTDEFVSGINHLRFRGHNVVVFHVLHEEELTFPFQRNTLFRGLEEAELEIMTEPMALRKSYLAALDAFQRRVRTICTRGGVDYVPLNTSDYLDAALSGYIASRQRVTHTRRR